MHIEKLQLQNFRNYRQLDLALDRYLNFFTGENAQGKTNLLESLVFAASGRSFRTRNDSELIFWEENACSVAVNLYRQRGREKISIGCRKDSARKNYYVNGVAAPRSDYLGRLLYVLFVPDDLAVVKGTPRLRRDFFDSLIAKVYPVYEHLTGRYLRIVRQRNKLLRDYGPRALGSSELASWNEQLVVQGAKIIRKRLYVLHRLSLLARLAHRRLTGGTESLKLSYCIGCLPEEKVREAEIEEQLQAVIKELAAEEARLGQTLAGPHRDDFIFSVNGRNARLYASQGQQRTILLAVKLAEVEFIKGESGELPVLLLDDVFSELDTKRRNFLLENFIDRQIQTLITGTAAAQELIRHRGSVFTVKSGEVHSHAARS